MTDPRAESARPTGWPICCRGHDTNRYGRHGHVGNEDFSRGSSAWGYVDKRGSATCSCCDPANGFPCLLDPRTPPGEDER